MKIKITKEDLEGSYDSTIDCPLARALKRLGHKHVYVGGMTVDFDRYVDIPIINAGQFTHNMHRVNPKEMVVELDL